MANLPNDSGSQEPQASIRAKEELIAKFLKIWNRKEFDARAREIVDTIKGNNNWPRYSDGERIKFQISYRAKEEKSLKDKLLKLPIQTPEAQAKRLHILQDQINSKRQFIDDHFPEKQIVPDKHAGELKSLESEHQKIVDDITTLEGICNARAIRDLAGVRILAYFPDDVPIIAQQVGKLFDILGKPYLKDAGKSRQPRQPDKFDKKAKGLDEGKNPGFIEYAKGAFKQVSMNNVERDWKHAGYRAIHFHVKQKEDTNIDVDGEEEHSEDEDSEDEESEDEDSEDEDPDLWRKRVEIQVSTSVMHAWSEVEHDLIYKNPWQLAPNMTMDRMVDAINGLAITSEILLQQLQSTFNSLREDDAQAFENESQLVEWITEVWPVSATARFEIDEKDDLGRWLHSIFIMLQSPLIVKNQLTKRDIRLLVNPQRITKYLENGFGKFDALNSVILEKLRAEHISRKEFEEHDLVLEQGFPTSKIRWFYKIFLASVVFSICRLTGSTQVLTEWPSLDKMDKINNILLGKISLSEVYQSDQTDRGLADYSQQVLDKTFSASRAAAVAYAELGFCIDFRWYHRGHKNFKEVNIEKAERGIPVDFRFIQDESLWTQFKAAPLTKHPVAAYFKKQQERLDWKFSPSLNASLADFTGFVYEAEESCDGPVSGRRIRYDRIYIFFDRRCRTASLEWIPPRSIKRYLDYLIEQDEGGIQ